MIFTRATHAKGSLQPISMICPKVAGRSLAESVNLPARCCTLLSSAVKMAELVQQLELLLAPLRPQRGHERMFADCPSRGASARAFTGSAISLCDAF